MPEVATPPSTPAGWYAYPGIPDRLRWWDGEAWSQETLPMPPAPSSRVRELPSSGEESNAEELPSVSKATDDEVMTSASPTLVGPAMSKSESRPKQSSNGVFGEAALTFVAAAVLAGIVVSFIHVDLLTGIGITAVFALIAAIVQGTAAQKRSRALGSSMTGALSGVSFAAGTVSYNGQRQSIRGVTASVQSSGQIARYSDVGGMVVGGVLLGPVGALLASGDKKKDDRELYLMVTGESFQWVVKLNPKDGELARQFAARINSAALAAGKR